jgi:hypothetical protein
MMAAEYTPLTEREKVLFDLKGFLLFPAVLSDAEMAPIREQCEKLRTDAETLPVAERKLPGGAAAELLDHPAVMRVLHQIIDEDTEKIRCENCFLSYRTIGDSHKGWDPHAGGKSVNPNYSYQYHDGKIPAGMTRVVWELNGVEKGKGGTELIAGSHKSNYRKKLHLFDERDSGVWESYECPPGSLLIFSEAVRHSSCPWESETPRNALFFAYNHINVRHHKPAFSDEMLAALKPEHRRFFNEVYHPQFDRW